MGKWCRCGFHRRARKAAARRWPAGVLHAEPVAGIKLVDSPVPPKPDDVLLGYTIVPKQKLSHCQYAGSVAFMITAWPVAWIPAVKRCFYKPVQVAVYGPLGSMKPGPFVTPPTWGSMVYGYPVAPQDNVEKGAATVADGVPFEYDHPVKPATDNKALGEPLL